MKHILVYSLCFTTNFYGASSVDIFPLSESVKEFNLMNEQEIYPLEDFDTIFIVPENQDDQDLETEFMIVEIEEPQKFPVVAENFYNNNEQVTTVNFDNQLLQDEQNVHAVEDEDEDDIVPVPHELINNVKKANKKKKKLEKKERKSFLKKLKRNHEA